MKLPEQGLDSRRVRLHLRSRGPWRWRLLAVFSAFFAADGVMLSMVAVATLLGRLPALGLLNGNLGASLALLLFGLFLLWAGISGWRLARRRLRRRQDNKLSLAPHLLKKRS